MRQRLPTSLAHVSPFSPASSIRIRTSYHGGDPRRTRVPHSRTRRGGYRGSKLRGKGDGERHTAFPRPSGPSVCLPVRPSGRNLISAGHTLSVFPSLRREQPSRPQAFCSRARTRDFAKTKAKKKTKWKSEASVRGRCARVSDVDVVVVVAHGAASWLRLNGSVLHSELSSSPPRSPLHSSFSLSLSCLSVAPGRGATALWDVERHDAASRRRSPIWRTHRARASGGGGGRARSVPCIAAHTRVRDLRVRVARVRITAESGLFLLIEIESSRSARPDNRSCQNSTGAR